MTNQANDIAIQDLTKRLMQVEMELAQLKLKVEKTEEHTAVTLSFDPDAEIAWREIPVRKA